VATRAAAVIHHGALVLNAEARLRALVNDPVLGSVDLLELIPVQPPIEVPHQVSLEDALIVALHHRPEIDQVTHEIRAASVRLDVSKNEILPVLNLILSSYVYGLEGEGDVLAAFDDQFAAGRPSYSAGFLFEYPLGNRAAQARLKRTRLELRQLTNQLEATTWNVRLEVETAVRDITTAHREMTSHYHAMIGNETETEYQDRRWRLLPGDHQSAGIALDDLLDAQERLNRSEASYVAALVAYNVAIVQLKRAMGLLLETQPIELPAPPKARTSPADRASSSSGAAGSRASANQQPAASGVHRGRRPIAFSPPPIPADAPSVTEPSTIKSESRAPSPPLVEPQPSTIAPATDESPPALVEPSGPQQG
jgi:outer membrane protein TolC